jgi:hypothetical protein
MDPLKPKEGILLDPEGRVLHDPQSGHQRTRSQVHVFKLRWPGIVVLTLSFPLLFLVGLALLILALVFALLFSIFRPLLRHR